MGGACGAPRLLGIYLISNMHTKTIQKIQKAYIKTYEEDVKIYKDIDNSQGQGAFFLKTPVSCILKELVQLFIEDTNMDRICVIVFVSSIVFNHLCCQSICSSLFCHHLLVVKYCLSSI